jgi:hypothetical protein
MPFVFGIIGLVLIVSGVRGTLTAPANPNLIALVRDDVTGNPNYLEWMTAIFIIGAIGYIPQLRTFSRFFMALVVIGLLFANKGFFAAFSAQTGKNATTTPQASQSTGITMPNVLGKLFSF